MRRVIRVGVAGQNGGASSRSVMVLSQTGVGADQHTGGHGDFAARGGFCPARLWQDTLRISRPSPEPLGCTRFHTRFTSVGAAGISTAEIPINHLIWRWRLANPANHEGLLVRRRSYFHGRTIALAWGLSRRPIHSRRRCTGAQRQRGRGGPEFVSRLLGFPFCSPSKDPNPGCSLLGRPFPKPQNPSLCSSSLEKSAKAS